MCTLNSTEWINALVVCVGYMEMLLVNGLCWFTSMGHLTVATHSIHQARVHLIVEHGYNYHGL